MTDRERIEQLVDILSDVYPLRTNFDWLRDRYWVGSKFYNDRTYLLCGLLSACDQLKLSVPDEVRNPER